MNKETLHHQPKPVSSAFCSSNELLHRFAALMRKHPYSVNEYAHEMGVSARTLWKFIREEGMLGLHTLCKIENFLINEENKLKDNN